MTSQSVNTFLVKLLSSLSLKSKQDFFPNLFKDKHDEDFGFKLLKKTLQNGNSYNVFKTSFDIERIANIDFVFITNGYL